MTRCKTQSPGITAAAMKHYGIGYKQVDLKGRRARSCQRSAAARARPKRSNLVFIQRSRGYAVRKTLSCEEIGE